MSDVPDLVAAGLPEELGAVDQILHRGEANPRTRSGIMALEILDAHPDWERFRARLRERVAQGPAAAAEGRHADAADRGAALGRRPRLQPRLPRPPGARARAGDAARGVRPGRGRAAVAAGHLAPAVDGHARRGPRRRARGAMLHLSHAVTDGVGGVEMFANIYDLERDPPPQDAAPLPIPEDLSPNDLMREGINRLPGTIARRCRARVLGGAVSAVGTVLRDPVARRRRRRRLRDVRRPGDGAASPSPRRCCAGAACHRAARPSTSGSLTCTGPPRRRAARSTTPIWPGCVGRCGSTTRRIGRSHRHAADGGAGEPALRRRPGGRQPVRRGQSRRAGRPRRPGGPDQERSARR